MTQAQSERIKSIADDLKRCKDHPSPTVREAVKDFTPEQIAACVNALRCVCMRKDGWTGHMVISAWYKEGEVGVLKLHQRRSL